MKKKVSLAIALVVASGAALAQAPTSVPTPAAGQSGLNPSNANGSGMQITTGTVTDYTAGQKIALKLDGGQQLALDLERDVRVDGSVAVGQLAAIMWMTDNAGKKRVTSITAAPGPGDSGMSTLGAEYADMSRTPPATRSARSLTPGSATTPTPAPADAKPRKTPRASTSTPTGASPTPNPTPAPRSN